MSRHFLNNIVQVDLSNYAVKSDAKKETVVDTTLFAKQLDSTLLISSQVDTLDVNDLKTVPDDLNNLESRVNEICVDKLKAVPINLKKIFDVADIDFVKKQRLIDQLQILMKWRVRFLVQLVLLMNYYMILITKIQKKRLKRL